jgi:hypothetical protein
MREEKSNILCVCCMREGKNNMCYVYVTSGRAKIIYVMCFLHEEGQK